MARVIKRIEISPRSFSYELIVLKDYCRRRTELSPNIHNKNLIAITRKSPLASRLSSVRENCGLKENVWQRRVERLRPVNLTRTENTKRGNTKKPRAQATDFCWTT